MQFTGTCKTHIHTLTFRHPKLFKDVFFPFVLIVFQPLLGAVFLHSLCCNTQADTTRPCSHPACQSVPLWFWKSKFERCVRHERQPLQLSGCCLSEIDRCTIGNLHFCARPKRHPRTSWVRTALTDWHEWSGRPGTLRSREHRISFFRTAVAFFRKELQFKTCCGHVTLKLPTTECRHAQAGKDRLFRQDSPRRVLNEIEGAHGTPFTRVRANSHRTMYISCGSRRHDCYQKVVLNAVHSDKNSCELSLNGRVW